MSLRDGVSWGAGMVIANRLSRSGPLSRVFVMRAAEAAEQVLLGKSPTTSEMERIGEALATRALVMIYSPVKAPSKGALRDAGEVAGREVALEVLNGRN